MPTAPTLTDGTVTLRHPREDDVQAAWEQCQDPLSQQWTTVPIPYSMDDARDFILGFVPGAWESDKEWGFVVEAEGRYAGHITLRNEGDRRAELAYGSHPWVRGTGHMERAMRVLLDWGFTEKRLAMVIWWANDGNWASRKLAWRLGFTFEGKVRSWLPHRGELRDAWVGTLLVDDPREPQGRWLDLPELEGDKVRLRAMTSADTARVVEACRDERTRHWLGELPSPYDEQAAADFIAGRTLPLATGKGLSWAVADPVTDVLLGSIGLFDLTEDLAFGEIGYWTHPDARGRGVMTQAVALVLQHAFVDLGLRRVRAYAAVGNIASERVLTANGLKERGVDRLAAVLDTGREDAVLFDVLAEEWPARR